MSEKIADQIRDEAPSEYEKTAEIRAVKHSNAVIICMVLCTALVIVSQFVAAGMSERNFRAALTEIEYGKVGGESNYLLLQEIQRERTSSYLKDLEEKEPDYVRWLKKKIEGGGASEWAVATGKLTPEEISAFRSTGPAGTWSEAKFSVVEYSDFACPYCKEYHEAETALSFAKKLGADYALKILPNKKHEGSEFLAKAEKCVSETFGSGAFLEASEAVFESTGSLSEAAYRTAEKLGLDKASLDECVRSEKIGALVAKDSWQGMYLKIRATPSVFLLNHENGKYAVIAGTPDETKLDEIVENELRADE